MVAQEVGSRFPHVDKVLERIENSKNLVVQLALVFVAIGATMWDFPGALKKANSDFKQRSRQPPYHP